MLAGKLNFISSGHLVVQVPNSLTVGAFMSINQPGFIMPSWEPGGKHNACLVVMSPEEVSSIGPDRITERGKDFEYQITGTQRVPAGVRSDQYAERMFFSVSAPDLTRLRGSYGLGPKGGHGFKIVFAVRPWGAYRQDGVSKLDK